MNCLPTFYIGTTNPYKVREIASILRPFEIDLKVTDPINPEETGKTFEENALIKALAYSEYVKNSLLDKHLDAIGRREYSPENLARQCNAFDSCLKHLELSRVWTICEDSGVVIQALKELPGPWSARFADCTIKDGVVINHSQTLRAREEIDHANNLLVLELMKEVEQPFRVATFVVSFVVANIYGEPIFKTTSEVAGWILPEMKGNNGFGYDPIFASEKSFGKSYAEIDSMRKNLFSHRRKAIQQFTAWLAKQIV